MSTSDRRAKFRLGLNGLYIPIYDKICAALGPEWQPYYGLRTMDQQHTLYCQGRTTPGSIVTNADAGQSPHNYGCATDWTFWENGKPIWMLPGDKRWKTYLDAVEKAGARTGADFAFVDYPHNELKLSISWKEVKKFYDNNGLDKTMIFIGQNVAP